MRTCIICKMIKGNDDFEKDINANLIKDTTSCATCQGIARLSCSNCKKVLFYSNEEGQPTTYDATREAFPHKS